jgi:hypothetical protein
MVRNTQHDEATIHLALLRALIPGVLQEPAPDDLFVGRPGFALAWVFSLRKVPGSDVLHPFEMMKWINWPGTAAHTP